MPPAEVPGDAERRAKHERVARLVALGLAFSALWLAGIATYVSLTRDDAPESQSQSQIARDSAPPDPSRATRGKAPIIRHVAARDVVRLKHDAVEQTVDGVRVTSAALASALGLEPGDTLRGISGHALARPFDVLDAILTLSMMSVTAVYVEIQHGSASDRELAIWMLDGDLRTARTDDLATVPAPPVAPVSDPLVDTIRKRDDTHAEMPADTADKIAADPATYLRTTRALSWTAYGATTGVKLYALRSGSVLEAMLLRNGDIVHGVNGENISTLDELVDRLVKARASGAWTLDIERRHVAMILTITVR